MFKHYLITIFRNFWKNKIFSVINIIGLAIGISASLVIYLIVHYEFSFDKFEKDNSRVFRVITNDEFAGSSSLVAGVPIPLPSVARNEMTGLDWVAGFEITFNGNISVPAKKRSGLDSMKDQALMIYTDSNYFKLIPYQWLAGSPEIALNEPKKIVLTESKAKMYFPSIDYADIIGKKLVFNDTVLTTVSGIVRDLHENSDFNFQGFISLLTLSPAAGDWNGLTSASQMFIKVSPGVLSNNIKAQLQLIINRQYSNKNFIKGFSRSFDLQPLSDVHFNADLSSFGDHTASKPVLYGLLAVAAFLLLLACFNFINLTTAQSVNRAKEIGVRKTLGGSVAQLIIQFLNETFLLTLLATAFSLGLVPTLLKLFSNFIPADLHFNILHQPSMILFLVALILIITFLAGFYPAIILAKYNPVSVLRNQRNAFIYGTRKGSIRKTLTVTQFIIAQFFVIATVITVKQIHFMLNKDLGFKKEGIIYFATPYNHLTDSTARYVLMNELNAIPGIELTSVGYGPPCGESSSSSSCTYTNGKKQISLTMNTLSGDTNYLKLYHIKLLAGKTPVDNKESKEYAINETLMHVLGFQNSSDAINKILNRHRIVGVMADFNQASLRTPIKPEIFQGESGNGMILHVALKPNGSGTSWTATISKIEQAFKKIYPQDDFSYEFFDESIAKLYKSDEDISQLLKWSTGLAILISCMGLLGLAINVSNTRAKEIGIRKVLGASVGQIVILLSKNFIILVLLAFVVAVPFAWWATHNWLDNFAYRTTVNWWLFALCGIGMALIALITLSIQIIISATANPVENLKIE